MSDLRWLESLFEEVLREARNNSAFAQRLAAAIGPGEPRTKRRGRRAPGVVEPFEIYGSGGEDELRAQLAVLDVDQLKDIVAEHGMDQAKLALKWKDSGRLVDLIVKTVAVRVRKGDAFRAR